MQKIKIDNYERDNGFGTFVSFRHLSDMEADSIREKLSKCMNLPKDVLPEGMVKLAFDKSRQIMGVNAEAGDFDIAKLLKKLNFDLSGKIYLNWYRYDDIDEIETKDILAKFSDIWYPSADDLDLIDSELNWILMIHHSGTVSALDLKNEATNAGEMPT